MLEPHLLESLDETEVFLDVSFNSLTALKISVIEDGTKNAQYIESIDFAHNDLETFPHLSGLKSLESIHLGWNPLCVVPVKLFEYDTLTRLYLPGCGLSTFPKIPKSALNELSELELSFNEFDHIPQSILELPSLTSLRMDYNRIAELPESFDGSCAYLSEVSLAGNKLKNLEKSWDGLPNRLSALNLSHNELESVDDFAWSEYQRLKNVQLDHNALCEVPLELWELPCLRWLALEGNGELELKREGQISLTLPEDCIVSADAGQLATGLLPGENFNENTAFCNGVEVDDDNCGHCSFLGRRTSMEDVFVCGRLSDGSGVYAVLDGHGGCLTARILQHLLISELESAIQMGRDLCIEIPRICETVNQRLKTTSPNESSGSTVALALVLPVGEGRAHPEVISANVGDSRMVLYLSDGSVVPFSDDHRAECADEQARIRSMGGRVEDGRINGYLAVSRAFGDFDIDIPLSVEPSIRNFVLDPTLAIGAKCLVIACDGLWDVVSNEHCARILELARSPNHAAAMLCTEACCRNSLDNITVLVLPLCDRAFGVEEEPDNSNEDANEAEGEGEGEVVNGGENALSITVDALSATHLTTRLNTLSVPVTPPPPGPSTDPPRKTPISKEKEKEGGKRGGATGKVAKKKGTTSSAVKTPLKKKTTK